MSIQYETMPDEVIREERPPPPMDTPREKAPYAGSAPHGGPIAGPSGEILSSSQDVVVIDDPRPPRRKLPRIRGRTMILRTRETFHNRWPFSVGVAEIIFGFITLSLGVLEIMVIPLVMDSDPDVRFEFKESNCFGVGIWCGVMLILTGALAVRASLARRATTVYRFYLMTTITLGVYVIAMVLLIVGFSAGWTPNASPGEATAIATVHSINAVAVFIGFLLALVAFIQYYEDVFCGELQLCRRLGKIFCPCCCPLNRLRNRKLTLNHSRQFDDPDKIRSLECRNEKRYFRYLCELMDLLEETSKVNRKRGKNVPLDRYNRRTASQLV